MKLVPEDLTGPHQWTADNRIHRGNKQHPDRPSPPVESEVINAERELFDFKHILWQQQELVEQETGERLNM